ncbi:MAG: serine/threonine-protein kinase, partial [Pseudomonadota bacterium]
MSDPTVPPKAPPTPDAPVATDPPSPTEATDPAQTSPVGSTLNENYRVDRLIGAGGMGEVYEGEHLFTGNRVAIKMILQELSKDEGIVGLFRREARILFELADDAIVRYLDSFYHSGTDRYCLVMQFIDGIPLADRLEEDGPLPLGQVKALLRRLSLGLDKAHSLGVTHRDLSPDNVMLRDGQVEKAAIIDFGIATAEDKTEATLFGRFAGKYKFVAPEQLGLFKGVVGPWTDIYGLGLLIAAAARGTPLSMGGSFPEAVQAREVAPDLSDLPPRLQPLLQRMLQPDPKDRPASMAEVAAMLDDPSLLSRAPSADRTVIASPPGTRPKSSTTAEPTRLARPPGAPAPAPGLQTTAGLGQPLAGTNPGTDGPFRLTAPPDPGPPAATPKRNRWPIYAVLLLAMAGVGALGVSQRPDLLATWLGPTAP